MRPVPALLTAAAAASAVCAASPKHTRRGAYRRSPVAVPDVRAEDLHFEKRSDAFAPKAIIVSLFEPEMEVWHEHLNFTHNVTVPGLSPLFPHVFCVDDYSICNVVTGEGEINAASTAMALATSPRFDLTKTYFLVAGIAGMNPHKASLGSVAFSRFAVSIGMQDEFDYRDVASRNWSTGYIGYGSSKPGEYPGNFYGTEVFEFNQALQDRAAALASKATLADKASAQAFRKLYPYAPANEPPSVVKCDVATSDQYYTGAYLDNAFKETMKIWTNGTAEYCTTAQEDTAVASAFMRASKYGLLDYGRLVVMRSASDFDRAPPSLDAVTYFTNSSMGDAFPVAVDNLYHAGFPFINDVVNNWAKLYENNSFPATNYVGDVFGTLGGTPDFGFGNMSTYDYLA